jgi:hypothetical protein
MKINTISTDDVLLQKAAFILTKELGAVDALRVFSIPRRRTVDSIKRHRKWQQSLNADVFFEDAFGKTEKKSRR